MNDLIPTPRTEAEKIWAESGTGDEFECVHVDFARELERENVRLQARVAELERGLEVGRRIEKALNSGVSFDAAIEEARNC